MLTPKEQASLLRRRASLLLCVPVFALAPLVASFFAPDQSSAHAMASEGLALFSAVYLFAGMSILAFASFTALGNGALSALVASLRAFGLVSLGLFGDGFSFRPLIFPSVVGIGC